MELRTENADLKAQFLALRAQLESGAATTEVVAEVQ